jgi:multidrug efflux system membrane fusion protein
MTCTIRMHPIFRSLVLAGVAGALLSACGRDSSEKSDAEQTPTVPVKTAPVIRGEAAATVTATGRTDALRKEKVLSPVAGVVLSLKALEGRTFRAGDLMAVIRSRESQAAMTGAEALLRSARTRLQEQEARRTLALVESTQSTIDLRARFNGTVAVRTVSEGEPVGENAELFTLVDLSSLIFLADVPLASLSVVHAGAAAEIRFTGLPGEIFHGVVDAVSPQSDPQSQTVKVRLHFTAGPRSLLKADMAGTARIVTSVHRQALLVPRAALLRNDENNTYSVVVVGMDSLARTVQVDVGVVSDSTAEITGGAVREGMNVVVEGNYALADSTRVTTAGNGRP